MEKFVRLPTPSLRVDVSYSYGASIREGGTEPVGGGGEGVGETLFGWLPGCETEVW